MSKKQISGEDAFKLYDTYGFPLDLTVLLAEERGLDVDVEGFNRAMEAQRERARAAQKKGVIEVSEGDSDATQTRFRGYQEANLSAFQSRLVDQVTADDRHFLVFDETPFYAEMGGQLGDTGSLRYNGSELKVVDVQKNNAGQYLHQLDTPAPANLPEKVELSVDRERRRAIQRHHTATHILHWALRKVLGSHVRQAGSYVGPDRLRFDFSHFEAIKPEQIREIERLCNGKILENLPVRWYELPMSEKPDDIVAFFGEKYGNDVRVVEIGGEVSIEPNGNSYRLTERRNPGFSAELCGGTHVSATGEIGILKVVGETAISAGTRRIEAFAGEAAAKLASEQFALVQKLAARLSCKPEELETRFEKMVESQHTMEKELRALKQKESAKKAGNLSDNAVERDGLKLIVAAVEAENPNALREVAVNTQKQAGEGVVVLGGAFGEKVTVVALASADAIKAGYKAGDIVRDLTAQLDGRGGGKPDFAMGGGKSPEKLPEVLENYRETLKGTS